VTSDLHAPVLVITVETVQHLVMRQALPLLDSDAFWRPGLDHLVVVLKGVDSSANFHLTDESHTTRKGG
jgi:hypothetical protein